MSPRGMGHAVAAVVTAVVLAPLALPGYVLRYDMVFVPRQPLSWEMIAPADALPRAVPLDALVSVANLAVPGWLLQRLALAAIVYLAALGAFRLVPARRTLTRVVAALAYAWTPFLAERLLLGQWALLLAYAMLPWLVAAARDVRSGRPGGVPRLVLAAAPAAVTPTGGLIALATVAVLLPLRLPAALGPHAPAASGPHASAASGPHASAASGPHAPAASGPRPLSARTSTSALAAVAALNTPWVVAALTGAAGGRSDPAGVAAFAARAENWAGAWMSLAGTGGIWNAQTVPASRTSPLAPVITVLLLAVAVIGYRTLRRRWPGGATRLLVLAASGFVLAVAGTPPLAPLLEWLVGHVPGAGLLRDGQKFLMPYALLVALGFALGAEKFADRLGRRFVPATGRVLLAGAVLLPVVVLPDLAAGAAGALRPVRYPADWDVVAERVAAAPGEVLSLPFEGYQRYAWARGTVVRDPAPRYLDAPVLMNDALRVGTVTVEGESPRAAQAAAHLAAGRPAAALGVRWVLIRRGSEAPPASVLSGLRLAHSGPDLELWENPAGPARALAGEHRASALVAHLIAITIVNFALVLVLRRRREPWYGPRTPESEEDEPWQSWPRSPSPSRSAPSSASPESSPRSAP